MNIYPLKVKSHMKSDDKLKIQNIQLVFKNSFGNIANQTPIFRLLKLPFFAFFQHLQRFPANKAREVRSQENFWQKPLLQGVLQSKNYVFINTTTKGVVFLKKRRTTPNFWLCDYVISSHFWFSSKPYHYCKVQSFVNLWWKVHRIWLRFGVMAEKTVVFPYSIIWLYWSD